jgi:hypothetical protein
MAFNKTQTEVQQKESYDIYNSQDKSEILNFEKELKPYTERSFPVMGRTLKGFELYLHENGMFVYSVRYPEGAVRMDKLEEYRIATMKYQALTKLWDLRRKAEEKEAERHQSLFAGATA